MSRRPTTSVRHIILKISINFAKKNLFISDSTPEKYFGLIFVPCIHKKRTTRSVETIKIAVFFAIVTNYDHFLSWIYSPSIWASISRIFLSMFDIRTFEISMLISHSPSCVDWMLPLKPKSEDLYELWMFFLLLFRLIFYLPVNNHLPARF